MKVGLEVSAAVVGRRSGVGNYVAHMIGGLQQIAQADPSLELMYFSNRVETRPGEQLFGPDGAAVYAGNRMPVRAVWLQTGLPASLAHTRPDLCHFPNYLAPILRPVTAPYLATMYDMSVYRCPQYQPYKTVAVHRAIVPKVARTARLIITISESARQDIVHYLKVDPARVRVINGSIGWPFLSEIEGELPPVTPGLRERYGLNFPYILSVGTLEPRKNHARLIEAFTNLVQQERLPHHLVMVGGHGWKDGQIAEEVRRSGLADRVHFLGYVPTTDLPGLYRAADAFAFPSLYEGFGLPVLEAMACGTPCLISTDPALVEVGGGATVAVDPFSVGDIAAGLYGILSDEKLSDRLREQGRERAGQFRWEQCATQTHELYQEVFEDSRSPWPYTPGFGAADSGSQPTPIQEQPIPPTTSARFDPIGSAEQPTTLERAIVQTLIYSDIFNFPLTVAEVQRYLIGQSASLSEIESCLATSTYLAARLSQQHPYLSLLGREEIQVGRQNQTPILQRQWRAARRWASLLRLVPFVRGVLVTGSLAAQSARRQDDIDLLLLVEPGRLWTCRALVIGLVYLARLQRIELCPNYLMALTDPALTVTQRDLYTARELAAMRLMFGGAAYQRLLSLNPWLDEMLPNAAEYARQQTPLLEKDEPGRWGGRLKRFGERLLGGRLGHRFEGWEQRKIAHLSRQPAAEACFTPDLCKGHFGNYGQRTLASFAERCATIDQD